MISITKEISGHTKIDWIVDTGSSVKTQKQKLFQEEIGS
jgi:hypothetical protein